MFADLGMDLVAADDPLPTQAIEQYVDDGRCWVAVDSDDRPIGYILVEMVDGAAHIEQVSVDPGHARRRVGATLIERAVEWAQSERTSAITLTTYVDVGWNGPYYERLGFEYLAECDETPGLRSKRAQEKSSGLDQWPRACMVRAVNAASTVEG